MCNKSIRLQLYQISCTPLVKHEGCLPLFTSEVKEGFQRKTLNMKSTSSPSWATGWCKEQKGFSYTI